MPKTRIYIVEIEIENFESHEHTFLRDFSPGFNCIAGLSDVGKSSVIRAVKLCAYNQFDQKMVRTGASFCRVKITTNIGSVEVRKGPDVNLWIIKRNDTLGEIKLDKVGKAEVKQACEVLGMKVITLGETEVPINIMDQLERHFFIDGIGDKKTTGSSRAEIIDEICGLNGAEEMIRVISLDQYRLTREITEAENRIKELEGKMYSEADIYRDQILLSRVKKTEDEIKTCESNISFMNQLFASHEEKLKEISTISMDINNIPIIEDLEFLSSKAIEDISVYQKMESLWDRYLQSTYKIEKLNASVLSLQKTDDISLEGLKDLTLQRILFSSIWEKYTEVNEKVKTVSYKLLDIPDLQKMEDWTIKEDVLSSVKLVEYFRKHEALLLKLDDVNTRLLSLDIIEEAEENIHCLNIISDRQKIYSYFDSWRVITDKLESVIENLSKTKEDLDNTENKLHEIYLNIEICPVTKIPIGNTCSLVRK